jgi:hypothetical protein
MFDTTLNGRSHASPGYATSRYKKADAGSAFSCLLIYTVLVERQFFLHQPHLILPNFRFRIFLSLRLISLLGIPSSQTDPGVLHDFFDLLDFFAVSR